MYYTIIHTAQPKRAVQVIQVINSYNADVQNHQEKIRLQNLPYEPRVITFTKETKPRDHVVGRNIETSRKALVSGETSTYTFWSLQNVLEPTTTNNKRGADDLPEKRLRMDDTFVGKSAVVFEKAASELRSTLDTKTRELELLKGNYSALERSSIAIRSTAQATIDELTTAGAGKDASIAALTASTASKDAKILELTTAAANLETKCGEVDRLRRLVEKTKDELAARDAEILELRKPSTAGPASAKDQHPGLLQFKAGAGKYDAAMKQVRDLEAKLKTATDEMNRLYGEVNRLEQELERAAPPAPSGGGGPGWADQFVLSNAKWVFVSPCLFFFSNSDHRLLTTAPCRKHLEELQRLPMHEQTKKVLRLEAELLDKEVAIMLIMSGHDRSISHAHQTQWASIMKKIQEDAELKHCRYREKCLQNPGRLPGGYGGKR